MTNKEIQTVCFMAEYFLPDTNRLKISDIGYEIRVLEKEEFENLYLPEWSNVLCADRKNLDKVPFYCCAWSNVSSARNAIKSGFSPAWVEMTIKPIDVVQGMIG